MKSFATLGARQQELLRALLASPGGMSIDQLRRELGISRNAVIQHLQSLERLELVENARGHSTVGRPGKVYFLSPAGRELFPRHYALFSNLLLSSLRGKYGEQELCDMLDALGRDLAEQFRSRVDARGTLAERVEQVALIMQELGYETGSSPLARPRPADTSGGCRIIASNCVFRKLAQECPAVCRLDLALLESLAGAPVRHEECVGRGGSCCRFRFEEGEG